MRATQGQELVTRDEPVRAEVFGEFARIQAAEKAAASLGDDAGAGESGAGPVGPGGAAGPGNRKSTVTNAGG